MEMMEHVRALRVHPLAWAVATREGSLLPLAGIKPQSITRPAVAYSIARLTYRGQSYIEGAERVLDSSGSRQLLSTR
jgi:hypothetical protein